MKKLQLKALQFGAEEKLTREQLRDVLGGNMPTSSGMGCGVGSSCSVFDPNTGITKHGNCTLDALPGFFTWQVVCHCDAAPAGTTLSSNGGQSRCGSF